MSDPSLRQPMGPLSVGNVVSAALVLYRSHLKTYMKLALAASLWVLVPVYGWAKYWAISAIISRLAFGELISQPESVSSSRDYISSRLWSFFRVGFQVFFMLIGVYFGLLIGIYFVVILVGFGLGLLLSSLLKNQILLVISIGILIILGVLGFLFGFTWFFARWLVAEVPLAVEENINGKQSIERSWQLTKNSVRRIQGIVIVAFLVTLPILILTAYAPQIVLLQLEQGSNLYWFVYVISFLTSLVGRVLISPFWQSIKAVLYYDLRSRREGLGLQLRDSM